MKRGRESLRISGVVKRGGEVAEVEVAATGCYSCPFSNACWARSFMASRQVVRAKNPENAREGEVVWIEPDDAQLLRYSLLLYGSGILILLVFCGVGGIFGDVGAVIGAIVGIVFYLIFLWSIRGRFSPRETALTIRKEEGGD